MEEFLQPEIGLKESKDVNFKSGGGRETLVEPDDATKFFPELKPLIDKWAPRLGELQVTVDIKPADANFEPKLWDGNQRKDSSIF